MCKWLLIESNFSISEINHILWFLDRGLSPCGHEAYKAKLLELNSGKQYTFEELAQLEQELEQLAPPEADDVKLEVDPKRGASATVEDPRIH